MFQNMVGKFWGVILILSAVMVFYLGMSEEQDRILLILFSLTFLALGLHLLIKKAPTKEQLEAREAAERAKEERKREQQRLRQIALEKQRDRESRFLSGEHMTGLPVAPGAACSVLFNEDHALISSSGLEFRLAFAKMTDLQLVSDVDIQKSYVSSVGGAVGGALVFGSLGAMVGGRAKEKTSKVEEHYFVITYKKDKSIEYFALRVPDTAKATKIITRYKPKLLSFRAVIEM